MHKLDWSTLDIRIKAENEAGFYSEVHVTVSPCAIPQLRRKTHY